MEDGLRKEKKEKDECFGKKDKGSHGVIVGRGGRAFGRCGFVETLLFWQYFTVLVECFSVSVHGSSSCNTKSTIAKSLSDHVA